MSSAGHSGFSGRVRIDPPNGRTPRFKDEQLVIFEGRRWVVHSSWWDENTRRFNYYLQGHNRTWDNRTGIPENHIGPDGGENAWDSERI